MSDETKGADVVQLSPERVRMEDAHAFIDQRIANGSCTGLLVLTIHEDDDKRDYCYQRFGSTLQSDRVLALERAKAYEMLDIMEWDSETKGD